MVDCMSYVNMVLDRNDRFFRYGQNDEKLIVRTMGTCSTIWQLRASAETKVYHDWEIDPNICPK